MSAPDRPYALLAELTHRCPLQCPYCSNPLELERAGNELTTDEWRRVIAEAAEMGVLQIHFSGGEPTARRDLTELVKHATEVGLYSNLITAGVLLDAHESHPEAVIRRRECVLEQPVDPRPGALQLRRGDLMGDTAAAVEADARMHPYADGLVHRQPEAPYHGAQLFVGADAGAAAGEIVLDALEDGDAPADRAQPAGREQPADRAANNECPSRHASLIGGEYAGCVGFCQSKSDS